MIALVLGAGAAPAAAGRWAVDLGGGVDHLYASRALGDNHLAVLVPVEVTVRRALGRWQLGGGVELGWMRSGALGQDVIMSSRALVGGGWRGARMRGWLGAGLLVLAPSPIGADAHLDPDRGVVIAAAVGRSLRPRSRWSVTLEVAQAHFAGDGRVITTGLSLTWSSR